MSASGSFRRPSGRCEMPVCLSCKKPIPYDSKYCMYCGNMVSVEKVERLGTVDITTTLKDIKDWRRDEIVFTFFCLAFLVLGILSILLDFPAWCTILCFIALAVCLAVILYSHHKVTDLKRQPKERESRPCYALQRADLFDIAGPSLGIPTPAKVSDGNCPADLSNLDSYPYWAYYSESWRVGGGKVEAKGS